MKIRVQMPEGTSSVSVDGSEYVADKDGVVTLDNPEHVATLVGRHAGIELGKDGKPGATPMLIGSSHFPAMVDVGQEEPRQLGDVVAEAQTITGVSVDEWNNLPQIVRDLIIGWHVAMLRGELGDIRGEREAKEEALANLEGLHTKVEALQADVDRLRDALKVAGVDPDKVLAPAEEPEPAADPDFPNMTKAKINEWLAENGGEQATGDLPAHIAAGQARLAVIKAEKPKA